MVFVQFFAQRLTCRQTFTKIYALIVPVYRMIYTRVYVLYIFRRAHVITTAMKVRSVNSFKRLLRCSSQQVVLRFRTICTYTPYCSVFLYPRAIVFLIRENSRRFHVPRPHAGRHGRTRSQLKIIICNTRSKVCLFVFFLNPSRL